MLLLLCVTFAAQAAVGDTIVKSGNLWYRISSTPYCTLVPVPSGEGKYSGAVEIPAQISVDGKSYNVAYIATNAFFSNKITSITLPGSLQEIGDSAFYNTDITEVTFPESPMLRKIGYWSFAYNSKLKKVTFSSRTSFTNISEAFYGCDSLNEFVINPNNKNYKLVDGVLFDKSLKNA